MAERSMGKIDAGGLRHRLEFGGKRRESLGQRAALMGRMLWALEG